MRRVLPVALTSVVVSMLLGLCIGPSNIPWQDIVREVLSHLPLLDVSSSLSPAEKDIVWQIRMPRVVLALLVGAMLSISGAAYQGVFRNPLADPYLLGSAAGAGLGVTIAIGAGVQTSGASLPVLPMAAFVGALLAVAMTYGIGSARGRVGSAASLIVAGVAVTSLLTAVQTFLQQRDDDTIREVYAWMLGRLSGATWDDVWLMLPYAVAGTVVMVSSRRLLDVMTVGEEEATTLGIPVARIRLGVVIGASVATAAAVSVSGLIGFVGVIVPHTVRLFFGTSYRRILPLSLVFGGAFLVLTDVIARTVLSPAEVPIGVVTAALGAPFFLVVLRARGGVRIS